MANKMTVEALPIPTCGRMESPAVPAKAAQKEGFKIGIDEAGRGPVLGAMTFGICYWALSDDAAIEKDQKEINDSKQLTEEQRSRLFERVMNDERMGWGVEVVSATRISAEMLQKQPTSLNQITFDATTRLIRRALARGVDIREAYVDTVGDPETYAGRLTREFDGAIRFTVEKKADGTYKCCGAASICAKVTRDESIRRWVFEEGSKCDDRDFGSGYPSDDICKQWLMRNVHHVFGYPSFCRFSWATAKTALGETPPATDENAPKPSVTACKVEWDEGEDDAAANTMKITEWATVSKKKQSGPAPKKRKRARYYRDLESVGSLAEL